MTITFPLYQLTSYEEESASWILEPGMYGIWIGNDLNTSVLSGALELDEKAVMTACENICPLKEELNEIVPDAEKVQAREAAWQKEVKEKRMSVIELKASEIPTEKVDYQRYRKSFLEKQERLWNPFLWISWHSLQPVIREEHRATRLAPQEFLFREQQRRHPRVLRRSRGM
ncbi:hypothetical protein [Blautia sp. AF34-10]|uniref:hypothetical protein n=1 Tax=Blautia sp. AF34-10 TaxID=2292968 RepID=UPI001FAB19A2|nr:hypothetical protein [Blautia sp. AF34-10]